MNKKSLAILCLGSVVLCLLSLLLLDRPLALWVHGSGIENSAFFVQGTKLLDLVTGRTLIANRSVATFLLGGALLGLGLLGILFNRSSYTARALLFTGSVQLCTVLAASLVKSLFGRLRPFELFANGHWDHAWNAGGNSFPSGHVSFYWGLFVPLAYLFPRFRIPLMIIPVFIFFARIDESAHFLSDVLGAVALSALITLVAAVLLQRWVHPTAR